MRVYQFFLTFLDLIIYICIYYLFIFIFISFFSIGFFKECIDASFVKFFGF